MARAVIGYLRGKPVYGSPKLMEGVPEDPYGFRKKKCLNSRTTKEKESNK